MAAPAQRLANRSSDSKTPDTGDGGLQNGSSEDLNSDDGPSGNLLINNRVKANNCGPRDMKMDSFQDGGSHARPSTAEQAAMCFSNVERTGRVNSDYPGFAQNPRDPMMMVDEYRNSQQENANHGYAGSANFSEQQRAAYEQQHGGQPDGSNSKYQGYPTAGMRYPTGARPRPNQPQMYSNSQQQHRFLSGPAVNPQGGPTPTLNQLLQAPNPLQRFQNSYEYNVKDVNAGHYPGSNNSATHGWSPTRYPQQIQGMPYRAQAPSDPSLSKRPYQQSGTGGQAYPQAGPGGPPYPQHPQGQHRPPYMAQPPQPRAMGPAYPPPQPGQTQPSGGFGMSNSSQPVPSNYDQRSQGPMATGGYGPQPTTQQQQLQSSASGANQSPQDVALDELSSDSNSCGGGGAPSGPLPPPQQGAVTAAPANAPPSSNRATPPSTSSPSSGPSPSAAPPPSASSSAPPSSSAPGGRATSPAPPPVGTSARLGVPSPSARSMSPAIAGQQPNIPMPPRPSSQSDSSNSSSGPSSMNQPTAVAQGYPQQMAPPPMYGNKMAHGAMMGQQQGPMGGPYSPHTPSHYPPQGNYRQQNSLSGYGSGNAPQGSSSQNNYPGAAYPPSMINRMPNHASQSFSPNPYMNSQYPGYMNNMMPPPSQYPKSMSGGTNATSAGPPTQVPPVVPPTAVAASVQAVPSAQAAAQAAVVAAASAAGPMRTSPMYLRQHLQQKLYSGYNNNNTGMPDGGLQGIPQGATAAGLNRHPSPRPPQTSTPGGDSENANGVPSSPSVAGTTTSVTQSISSPVPSVATVSSPSLDMSSSRDQQPLTPGGGSARMGPLPPPPLMDEASQASNASASSSLPDDRSETPKPTKVTMSHPPTPNTLPSPGAASMSSFHDEFESVSSPSWPRTPASPVVNNQGYDHHPIKRPDGLLKLYDISEDPDRRHFLDKLILYSEERGTPLSQCPTISKQPLDLYRLYLCVKERGGFVEVTCRPDRVTRAKHWKDVAGILGIGASSSAAYTLRKQYIKHILPFECKYDRGGIDPQPIINSVESASRKKGAKNNPDTFPPPSSQSLDGYPPGAYPGGHYPPHAGMMINSEYPQHMPPYAQQQHPNHQHHQQHMAAGGPPSGDGYPDPYEEGSYPRHPGEATVGGPPYGPYSQQAPHPQVNTMMPSFGSTQSSISGGSYGYSGNVNSKEFSGNSGCPPQAPEQSFGEYPSATGPHPHMPPNASSAAGEAAYRGSAAVDPYGPPAGGFPPNRTVGPHNASAQYPYQYDRERYEGTQATPGGIPRPPNASQAGGAMMGPPNNQSEHPIYPQPAAQPPQAQAQPPGQHQAQQRYPVGAQPYPPNQSPQHPGNVPPRSVPQYPNSGQSPGYPLNQQEAYRGTPDGYPMHRMQTSIAQRLLTKTAQPQQSYNQQTSTQAQQPPQAQPSPQTGYPVPGVSPNKVPPGVPPRDPYSQPQPGQPPIPPVRPDMYGAGPKRHPDFMKPPSMQPDGYGMGPGYQAGQPTPQQTPQQQQQQPPPGAYPDRSQYSPYRPSHMMMPPNSSSTPQPGWGRDNRVGGNYPNSYPPPPQQRADGSQGWEGGQNWTNCSPRYGPQGDPYANQQHRPGMKMPPYHQNRIYMSPNKMPPHPGMGQQQQQQGPSYPGSPHQTRKELIFPPDTVEGVSPVLIKRRRLHAKDVSPVEAWRLMMALKSGLLAESTWALDVLSVLLYDDTTVLYFGLTHMPGLLEVLMEHFRRCLNMVFSLTEDVEIGYEDRRIRDEELFPPPPLEFQERPWYDPEPEPRKDLLDEVLGSIKDINPFDKTVLLNSENYSFKTRCNKVVRCKPSESLFLLDPEKRWDCYEGFNSGMDHWQLGGGDQTQHIQMHFESAYRTTRFPRVMKDEVSCLDHCESSPKPERKYSLVVNCKKLEPPELVAAVESVATSAKEEERTHEEVTYPRLRDNGSRKRLSADDLEDESYMRDEPSLRTVSESQDSLVQRCMCLSTLLRNLSFVPGNDSEMAKHAGFLLVMGRLLLLHHVHAVKKPNVPKTEPVIVDKEEEETVIPGDVELPAVAEDENPVVAAVGIQEIITTTTASTTDSCSSLQGENEWWWDMLHVIRENTLVTLANISGHLDLAPYPEEISLPLLDGLLHWAVCPSSYSQDSLPNLPMFSVLSPQRLSLEALCKLSILDNNVDLLLATPPWWRLEKLFAFLSRSLAKNEDQVLREFSVVLLSNLAQADSSAARAVALQGTAISQLITFVEQAEQSALQVANSQGINALRENPELMGTTLDMVRRAAATLRCLALVPDNRPLFLQHQQRLLTLVMSQILDQGVASLVADVLFECSKEDLRKEAAALAKPVAPPEKDDSEELLTESEDKDKTSETPTEEPSTEEKES